MYMCCIRGELDMTIMGEKIPVAWKHSLLYKVKSITEGVFCALVLNSCLKMHLKCSALRFTTVS